MKNVTTLGALAVLLALIIAACGGVGPGPAPPVPGSGAAGSRKWSRRFPEVEPPVPGSGAAGLVRVAAAERVRDGPIAGEPSPVPLVDTLDGEGKH